MPVHVPVWRKQLLLDRLSNRLDGAVLQAFGLGGTSKLSAHAGTAPRINDTPRELSKEYS